jgi:hypothetical protein
MFRTVLIFLRYFWMTVPAVGFALGAAWLFAGMGFWMSVFTPFVLGLVAFGFFSTLGMALSAACGH